MNCHVSPRYFVTVKNVFRMQYLLNTPCWHLHSFSTGFITVNNPLKGICLTCLSVYSISKSVSFKKNVNTMYLIFSIFLDIFNVYFEAVSLFRHWRCDSFIFFIIIIIKLLHYFHTEIGLGNLESKMISISHFQNYHGGSKYKEVRISSDLVRIVPMSNRWL